jgi:UDP-sugar pyrophosphorylase
VQNWPEGLLKNESILNTDERELASMLVEIGQEHLFASWSPPGENDDQKHTFFQQVKALHGSYMPQQGGLRAYVSNAQKLLADSKNGVNPLDGWSPEVPKGISITPITDDFAAYDEMGTKDVACCGFVLVAGGLGERLGYNGIKIELPTETTTGMCYIELYCRQILAMQARYSVKTSDGVAAQPIPLAIMVSDDTGDKTVALLARHHNFGMADGQITILRQGKVPALLDNDGRLALENGSPYEISAKPHGHGDVHALMHETGTAQRWADMGVKWCFFFQDTNALAMYSLSAMLGVSMELSLQVNSRSVPRVAKQAVGAIVKLVNESSGRTMTVNVEYNQLDPLPMLWR